MTDSISSSTIQRFASARTDHERAQLLGLKPALAAPRTVRQLYDKTTELLRSDLDSAQHAAESARWLAEHTGHPPSRALSHRALGNVLLLKGQTPEALKHYSIALQAFEAIGDTSEMAATHLNLISAHLRAGAYEQALREASVAERLFCDLGDDVGVAKVKSNVASVLSRRDEHIEARTNWNEALRVFEAHDLPELSVIVLRNLAVCEISLNNFRSALSLYDRVAQHCERHNLTLLAHEVEYNIAYLYFLQGDYDRALSGYKQARERSVALGDHYHAALCDLDQAELYLELSLLETARELAVRAAELFRSLKKRYEEAKALTFCGIAESRLGDHHQAQDYFAAAAAAFQEEGNRPWFYLLALLRGSAFYREGRSAEARRAAAQAKQGFELLRNPAKVSVCRLLLAYLDYEEGATDGLLDSVRQLATEISPSGHPEALLACRLLQAQIEEAHGNTAGARQSYYAAEALLEGLRGKFRPPDLRLPVGPPQRLVFDRLLSLEFAALDEPALSTRALNLIEREKTRSLVDLLGHRLTSLPHPSPARSALVQRVRSLRDELQWYYRKIARDEMESGPADLSPLSVPLPHVHRLESELIVTLNKISGEDRAFRSVVDSVAPSLQEIQGLLGNDEVVLEFFLGQEVIFALALSRKNSAFRPLSISAEVDELQRLFEFQVTRERIASAERQQQRLKSADLCREYLRRLYQQLIEPFEDFLADAQRLVVIPDRKLALLPFHAFLSAQGHLTERSQVSYQASLASLSLTRQRPPISRTENQILTFPGEMASQVAVWTESQAWTQHSVPGGSAEKQWRDLLAKGWEAVHLPLGMRFRRDNPFFSSCSIAGTQKTLLDLFALRIRANVVILVGAGPEVARGGSGEEVIGLARSLLYAGASSVLLPLWGTDRLSEMSLLETFYSCLAKSSDPASAIKAAYSAAQVNSAHPVNWGGWALYGT